VYLGPTGHTGGVYSTQADVRRKQPIGAPEVSVKGHIGTAAASVNSVTLHTAGTPSFQERVYVNTSCIDLVSACVKNLGILFPPSNFGMISRARDGDSWVSPDALMSEVGTGVQLIVVPREGASAEIKKAYFDAITMRGGVKGVHTDSNVTPDEIATMPNQGTGCVSFFVGKSDLRFS
jgi:hypothetical protein